jgi:hypothetical protein
MTKRTWRRCQTGTILAFLVSVSPAVADLIGDNVGNNDITAVSAIVVGPDLVIDVAFNNLIAPPSAFDGDGLLGDSISGFIDLDTDQDSASPSSVDPIARGSVGVLPGLGAEFYLDLLSEQGNPGNVDVVDTDTGMITGAAAITFGAASFSVTVPLALLGNDDGIVNFGASIEDFDGTLSDVAGPLTNCTQIIPEPSTLTLCGIGIVGLLGNGWWRSRRSNRSR